MSDTTGLTIYVSLDGKDSWSGRVPKPNSDKTDGPLATLQRAFSLLQGRQGIGGLKCRGELQGTLKIQLRGGTYHITKPIKLTPEISWPTIVEPFPGEEVFIDGGQKISGWRNACINGKDVWETDILVIGNKPFFFNQLFVNGRRAKRPTLHWDACATIESLPDNKEHTGWGTPGNNKFVAREGDFLARKNIKDVEVVATHYWIEERLPVESYNPETRKVFLSRTSYAPLFADHRPDCFAEYYLENVFETFGQQRGEWYLDKEAGKIYYYPLESETIDSTKFVAPRIYQFLQFIGRPDHGAYVEHITFRSLNFQHTAWVHPDTLEVEESLIHKGRGNKGSVGQAAWDVPGVIYFKGARHCTIEDCKIEHIGWYGIELDAGCTNVTLSDNVIHDMGAGGIKLSGAPAMTSNNWNDNDNNPVMRTGLNRITDNHIFDGGHIFLSAIGILARHTFGNLIAHNHIHHLYYTGISVGWVWGYHENIARDNIIEKNHIHDIGQGRLSDMGGIYTLGVQPGTVIRGNLIHDIRKKHYGGWAIYPDEGSSHIVIENNICYNTNANSFHQHYGRENIVRNNIFAFSDEAMVCLSRDDGFPIEFFRNIVIADGRSMFLAGYGSDMANFKIHCFLNLYWDISSSTPAITGPIFINSTSLSEADNKKNQVRTLDEWQAIGRDAYSLVADPLVRNMAARDFTLSPDSPAIKKLGFQPIDCSDVGVRDKRKEKMPQS